MKVGLSRAALFVSLGLFACAPPSGSSPRQLAMLTIADLSAFEASAAHPALYYSLQERDALRLAAADTRRNRQGYVPSEAFAVPLNAAAMRKAERFSATMDRSAAGGTNWSYVLSAQPPPAHPSDPSYPYWTIMSRSLETRLETQAFAYALTGDSTHLTNAEHTGALDAALDLAAWPTWSDGEYFCGSYSGVAARTCLDTAHLTMGIAVVYDVAYEVMTDAQRATLRSALLKKALAPLSADLRDANADPAALAWSNLYALRIAALAVAAAALRGEAADAAPSALLLAADSFRAFIGAQGAAGAVYEGHMYGAYGLGYLMYAAEVLARAGGEDFFQDPWVAAIPAFAAAFLGSDHHTVANFGDSAEQDFWPTVMFALAAHGNAEAQWYLETTGTATPVTMHPLLWSRPELAPVPVPGSGSAIYRDIGHASLRAGFMGAPVIAFKCGPPATAVGHNHFDSNSFVVSVNGSWVAADPGYGDYSTPACAHFSAGSFGHSTVVVDGTISPDGAQVSGDQSSVKGASLQGLFDGTGYGLLEGRAASTYPAGLLNGFQRRIVYAKPDLFFVLDQLDAPQPHAFSFLLRSAAEGWLAPGDSPEKLVARRGRGQLEAMLLSSVPIEAGYPAIKTFPGAESLGVYGEWRTSRASSVSLFTALVPSSLSQTELPGAGFEHGLGAWVPWAADATVAADASMARTGRASARISPWGYVYSPPLDVNPGATLTGTVWFRAKAGTTGNVRVRFFLMLDGQFLNPPTGRTVTLPAADGVEAWRQIRIDDVVPSSGVDQVRLELALDGEGTVWFDDAEWTATPAVPPTPAAANVVALGSPTQGIAVAGAFGIDAIGKGEAGVARSLPAQHPFPAFQGLAGDGDLFAVGKGPDRRLRRAYVQAGTFVGWLGLDTEPQILVRARNAGTFDLALEETRPGWTELRVTEAPQSTGQSYQVNAGGSVARVYVNGQPTPFVQDAERVSFPEGDSFGPPEEAPASPGADLTGTGCACDVAAGRQNSSGEVLIAGVMLGFLATRGSRRTRRRATPASSLRRANGAHVERPAES